MIKEKLPSNFKTFLGPADIKNMIQKIAQDIRNSYSDSDELVCVGVLKGAWIFHADLVRALECPVTVDFMRASSYGAGTKTSGVVRILKDIEVDIRDKHVLVVEEIVDSGRTLDFIKKRLEQSGAKSVKVVALLDKKERREVDLVPDFVGAIVENYFLVGYGLDWGEKYRYLDSIYQVIDEKLR